MIKFSTQQKMQPTPPVCKGVPPPPVPTVPPPGGAALAAVFYTGATTGAPVDVHAVIPLHIDGSAPGYRGQAVTADGTRLELSCVITDKPPFASCTLIGQTANDAFFASSGASDAISYDPWLNGPTWPLAPAAAPAASGMSLTQ